MSESDLYFEQREVLLVVDELIQVGFRISSEQG